MRGESLRSIVQYITWCIYSTAWDQFCMSLDLSLPLDCGPCNIQLCPTVYGNAHRNSQLADNIMGVLVVPIVAIIGWRMVWSKIIMIASNKYT